MQAAAHQMALGGGSTLSLPTCTGGMASERASALFCPSTALQIAILESQQGPASTVYPQQQQQQQPHGSLQAAAAGLPAGAVAPNDAQLLQTLLSLSSQQLPLLQQPAQQLLPLQPQPAQQPVQQLGSQGGLWEQRLRAQLASGQGGSNGGISSLPPGNYSFQPCHFNSLGPQPPAVQQQQPAPPATQQQQQHQQHQQQQQQQQQQQAQAAQQQRASPEQQQQAQQAQQQALPVDDAVSMLLNCFPPPAGGTGIGSGLGSDLKALLNSSGSESGDSLLGSLLRAAGGQPGVDDLAAMLSSL